MSEIKHQPFPFLSKETWIDDPVFPITLSRTQLGYEMDQNWRLLFPHGMDIPIMAVRFESDLDDRPVRYIRPYVSILVPDVPVIESAIPRSAVLTVAVQKSERQNPVSGSCMSCGAPFQSQQQDCCAHCSTQRLYLAKDDKDNPVFDTRYIALDTQMASLISYVTAFKHWHNLIDCRILDNIISDNLRKESFFLKHILHNKNTEKYLHTSTSNIRKMYFNHERMALWMVPTELWTDGCLGLIIKRDTNDSK
jgi:hypothetical protein